MKIKYICILGLSSMLLGFSSCGSLTSKSTTQNDATEMNSILTTVLGSVVNSSSSITSEELVGTWKYSGAACSFESESLLLKAGGETLAQSTRTKLDKSLQEIGIKKGSLNLTLNSNNTFGMKVGKKTYNGTYTYDESNQKLTFTFLEGLGTATATLSRSSTDAIQILFESKKLYSFLSKLNSLPINNSSLTTVVTLLNSYDGILAGMTMQK